MRAAPDAARDAGGSASVGQPAVPDAAGHASVGPAADRLRLLASAIGGRSLEVGVAGVGEPAWTDGTTVYVDAAMPPAEQVRAVGVQASLLAAGSLDPAIVRQLGRRPALARRYLAVEGHRALAANEALLPRAVLAIVDRDVAASVETAEDSVALARGTQPIADAPSCFGIVRPRRLLACATTATGPTADAAAQVPGAQPGAPTPDVDDLDGDEAGHDVGNLLSSPVGGRGALGRLLQRMLRATRRPGGGGPAGAEAPTHRGRSRPHGQPTATLAPAPSDAVDAGAAFRPATATYPEWDVARRRYRLSWCTVCERDPRPADLAPLTLPTGLALRRPLARLGTGFEHVHRRPQGDDIDLDAVVDARAAALTGGRVDEAVYVENLRRRRDLAVLILLDVSGSVAEAGPAGRTVHEHQRSAAAALAVALHDLGDRVALHAFSSNGRTAVHVTRVKRFADPLDGRVARRLGGLVPGGYTRLGAAVRHGTAIVEATAGTSQRLLLVLSDGFAYDHGYDGRYGEADARRALLEARRRGVGCLCLSVGAGTAPAALRRVFGTAAHAAVPSGDALPGLVGPLFRAALRSAEAQRRTFQRIERTRHTHQVARRIA